MRSPASHHCRRDRGDQLSGLRRGRLRPAKSGSGSLSDQIIFFLHLPVEALQFGFLNRTNAEAAFCWPATVVAKMCGIRELKSTIQTLFGHRCSPHLSFVIDSDGIVGWGTSSACHPLLVLLASRASVLHQTGPRAHLLSPFESEQQEQVNGVSADRFPERYEN